jgi:DNA-binding NarL/FixJ family response regulator
MRRLKILIADDHRLMLSALRLAFEADPGFDVVGEATDGSQVLPLVGTLQPDIVLLDLKMPLMDGLACLKHLRKRFPEVRAAILSAVDDQEIVRSAFRHGAAAYILKRINPCDLPAALRQAMEGTVYQPFGAGEVAENPMLRESGLTTRELEVLTLAAEGKSNKQIASELFLAVQTVKFHLTSLYRKLDAATRTEAIRQAYRLGLLDLPLLDQVN